MELDNSYVKVLKSDLMIKRPETFIADVAQILGEKTSNYKDDSSILRNLTGFPFEQNWKYIDWDPFDFVFHGDGILINRQFANLFVPGSYTVFFGNNGEYQSIWRLTYTENGVDDQMLELIPSEDTKLYRNSEGKILGVFTSADKARSALSSDEYAQAQVSAISTDKKFISI